MIAAVAIIAGLVFAAGVIVLLLGAEASDSRLMVAGVIVLVVAAVILGGALERVLP
jgi:hypothetical protein